MIALPGAARVAEAIEALGGTVVAQRDLVLPDPPDLDPAELVGGRDLWVDAPDGRWLARLAVRLEHDTPGSLLIVVADPAGALRMEQALEHAGARATLRLARGARVSRREARIVVAEAGALHDPLLVHCEHWRHIWRRLSLLALQDAQELTGALGSHAGLLLRRATRIAERSRRQWEGELADLPALTRVVTGTGLSNGHPHAEALLGAAAEEHAGDAVLRAPWLVVDLRAPEAPSADRLREMLAAQGWSEIALRGAGAAGAPAAPGIWSIDDPAAGQRLCTPAPPAPRHAACDPDSEAFRRAHLLAAAAEVPLAQDDDRWFGEGAWGSLEPLRERQVQEEHADDECEQPIWRYCGWVPPAALVLPEAPERDPFQVQTRGRRSEIVASLHHGEVARLAHPGAILGLGERHFRVREVDLEEREIRVSIEKPGAIASGRRTDPHHRRHHEIIEVWRAFPLLAEGSLPVLGQVEVVETVDSYQLMPTRGREPERVALDPPFVTTYLATAAWVDLMPRTLERGGASVAALEQVADLMRRHLLLRTGARHAAELLVAAYRSHAALDGGGIFAHEVAPHGTGMARAFLELLSELLRSSLRTLREEDAPPPFAGRLQSPPPAPDARVRRAAIALLELLSGAGEERG